MGRSRPNFSPKLEPIHRTTLYGDLIRGKLFLQGERGEKQIRS